MQPAELRELLAPEVFAALESETAVPAGEEPLRAVARLRAAGLGPTATAAVLTQARLRRRATAKFGPFAARMLFTEAGLEQATRLSVAAVHAGRFRDAGLSRIADLGCGIGGDAMALAAVDREVVAVERDEVTAAIAAVNLAPFADAVVEHRDATSVGIAGFDGLWFDPARRTAGHSDTRRVGDGRIEPSFAHVVASAAVRPTGVKLSPAFDRASIPADAEAQWVSASGDVVETVLWFGALARPGVTRAALVMRPDGAAELTGGADADDAAVGPLGAFVHEPDGAVIRARLIGDLARRHDARMLAPSIAYVTTDEAVSSPFLRSFRVVAELPLDTGRIKREVAARGIGRLEIKKRGVDIDPAAFRKRLSPRGDGEATLIATRLGGRRVALLAERVG